MITRTYECLDCKQWFEVDHDSGDEPEPPCPYCDVVLEWRPKSFNIGTVKGKAVDAVHKMIEQDYGVTNFKDNSRAGDVAFMPPPVSKEVKEAEQKLEAEMRGAIASVESTNPAIKEAIKGFYGGGGPLATLNVPQTLAASRVGPAAYTPDNNPMTRLHRMAKSGNLPSNIRIVGRG